MRCPHCSGEIPEGSHFCGICGNHIGERATAPAPVRSAATSSPSLFELPAARGPRIARIVVVITLNLILTGAGIAMIASYIAARADAEEKARPVEKRAASDEGASAPTAAPTPDTPVEDKVLASSVGASVSAPVPAAAGAAHGAKDAKKKEKTASGGNPAGLKPDSINGLGMPVDPWPDAGAGKPTDGSPSEVERFTAQIDALATRHQRQLHGCYRTALKSNEPKQPLEGRVDIRFRIMPDGSSQSVRTVANTTRSDVLSGCLVAVVDGWRFPTGASKPLDFVWPFRFRATRAR